MSEVGVNFGLLPHVFERRKNYERFRRVIAYSFLSIGIGTAVAFFLWALDRVTELHWQYPWLLYCLPLFGLISGLMYHYVGQNTEAGNNLVIEQVHEPGGGVPIRMAPLVLIGTMLTHLGGGSAGREGTAVQMGGSIGGGIASCLGIKGLASRPFLAAGMAAGFGAVFGTPVAGAVFALEVLVRGRIDYHLLLPCLFCAALADQVTLWWGIEHTVYSIHYFSDQNPSPVVVSWAEALLFAKVILASIAFGLASRWFIWTSHSISAASKKWIKKPWLRPVLGGVLVVALTLVFSGYEYLGLGVNANPNSPEPITIGTCFRDGGATQFSWLLKFVFTAITVGMAFKGGEVTPLFFIGAALGNALAQVMHAPVDLMAGLGFIAVFAGATKTPIACMVLGLELFGPHSDGLLSGRFLVLAAVACFVSCASSGTSSIYHAQRHKKVDE